MHPLDSIDLQVPPPPVRAPGAVALAAGLVAALLPLAACGKKDPAADPAAGSATASAAAPASTAPLAWKPISKFGLQASVPADVTTEDSDRSVFLGNGAFKMNVFLVDDLSQKTAADQRASLASEPGFTGFTREAASDPTWTFIYGLEPKDGKPRAGVSMRIVVGGKPWDCGVHGPAPEIVAQVAAACATVKPQ